MADGGRRGGARRHAGSSAAHAGGAGAISTCVTSDCDQVVVRAWRHRGVPAGETRVARARVSSRQSGVAAPRSEAQRPSDPCVRRDAGRPSPVTRSQPPPGAPKCGSPCTRRAMIIPRPPNSRTTRREVSGAGSGRQLGRSQGGNAPCSANRPHPALPPSAWAMMMRETRRGGQDLDPGPAALHLPLPRGQARPGAARSTSPTAARVACVEGPTAQQSALGSRRESDVVRHLARPTPHPTQRARGERGREGSAPKPWPGRRATLSWRGAEW